MTKMKKRTPAQGTFNKNLDSMTYDRIMSMTILDSEEKIRFLHDHKYTKMYVAFDGRTNMSYYAPSYQKVERQYHRLVENSLEKSNSLNG